MTLDYLSVVCGWNLKQVVISFPLGTIQLLRFLYLIFLSFSLLPTAFPLISVICVRRSSRAFSLEGHWALWDACGRSCGFAGFISGLRQCHLERLCNPQPPASHLHPREQLPHQCSSCVQRSVVSVSCPDMGIFQNSDDHI